MVKQNAIQMSLGSDKNSTNITVDGSDKTVKISFNSKSNQNIRIPTSTTMGRRIKQCCLHKNPANDIMLTLPENGRFFVCNGLPLVIESQYLENFRAAFYSPQLFNNDTEPMRETATCSASDYLEEIKDTDQYLALKESETMRKEEQKKYSLMKKNIHTLKKSLIKIGETLKDIEEYQAGIPSKENQKIRNHDPISDKCKIKRHVKHDECNTSQTPDRHLAPSKSAKYMEKTGDLNRIITTTQIGKISQGKRKTDSLPTSNKVSNLDNETIKKQTKQEEKPQRKNDQITKHSVRESDFGLDEKTMIKLVDNIKSTKLLLKDILPLDKTIAETPVEDASQTKIKTVAPPADNKVLDQAMITKCTKQEAKPESKENLIDSRSIRDHDFVPAEKTKAELGDNKESTKLKLDDIVLRDQIITNTPVEDTSQTKRKIVTQSTDNKLHHKAIEEEAKQETKSQRKENLIDNRSVRDDDFVPAEKTKVELGDNMESTKLKLDDIVLRDQIITDIPVEDTSQVKQKTAAQPTDNKLHHKAIEEEAKQEAKDRREENTNHLIRNNGCASANETITELADNVKSSKLIVNDILYTDQNKTDCSVEEASQRKNDSLSVGNEMLDHAVIEKQTKKGNKPQGKENQMNNDAAIEDDFASTGITVAEFVDTMKNSRLMLDDILQREKSMDGYKKKYIKGVEALYEDQQRVLGEICRVYDCSNFSSSEECNLVQTSADRQQDFESQTGKNSEYKNDCKVTSEEGILIYKSNSMPVISNMVKKQNLEERIALINVKLEKLIKEIQLLKAICIIEGEKIKSAITGNDRRIQETAAETNGAKTATDEGTTTNAGLPVKEVIGIISQTYEILKGEQDEGNIYESTLTHTVKKTPSIIDVSKYDELTDKEYIEAVSDAQTAMRKLEAAFKKLSAIFQKISLQNGVDYNQFHEENISGQILKGQKFVLRNGHEKATKDISKHHVETQITRKDEKLASRCQYIGFERIQDSSEREQSDSEEFSPKGTSSKAHVSSVDSVKESKGAISEEIESKKLKISEESSEIEISSKSREVPKRYDFNKGSISNEDFLENERVSIKTIKIPEYSPKTEKLFILPSAVRRKHFNQYLDDMTQPFPPRHSNTESTRINHDSKSAQQVCISPYNEDTTSFKRYSSFMDKPNEEKNLHLPEKSPVTESHAIYKSESDSVFLTKEGFGIQHEAEDEILSDGLLKIPEDSQRAIPTEHDKWKCDVINEETISNISKYELEPPEREVQFYSGKNNKFGSYVIEKGNAPSISQYESEPSQKNDRGKSNEDYKSSNHVIEERSIPNISQYESESSQEKDHQKCNEQHKFRSNIIKGGSISNILQYECGPSQRKVRQKSNDDIKFRSDSFEERTISSIFAYELEQPQKQRSLNKPNERRSYVLDGGSIASISQYELKEPHEPDKRTFGERAVLNSKEHSRNRYVPDEYVGTTLSEPDSEELDKIEQRNRSDVAKQKLNYSQHGYNSSNEKSRNCYVPEYFENFRSEPNSRELYQIEEENRYDVYKNEFKKSQRGHTSSNEKSRCWYAPEYVRYCESESSGKSCRQIDERCMPDISNYEDEQMCASDISNYNRKRSLTAYEDQDKINPTHKYMHRVNAYPGFPLCNTNILRKPNIPLKYQSNTSCESQREVFSEEVSLGYSLNKQNERHVSLPCAFNYEKLNKTAGTKPRDRTMAYCDMLGKTRKQNILDETPCRNISNFNKSMNQSDAPLSYAECSRKSWNRTINRPLSELQCYRNFGSLENESSQFPSWTNENIDRDRSQTLDVSCDYSKRNKIKKLYDEIMNNPK